MSIIILYIYIYIYNTTNEQRIYLSFIYMGISICIYLSHIYLTYVRTTSAPPSFIQLCMDMSEFSEFSVVGPMYKFIADVRQGGLGKISPLVAQIQREGVWSPLKASIVPGITVVRCIFERFFL